MSATVDEAFLALPSRPMADAALDRARALGATHADFRLERVRNQAIRLRDSRLEASSDSEDVGFAVRVVVDGTWGFASGIDLTPESAVRMAEQAVEVARTCRPVNTEPVELAPEPSYPDATWVSAYEIDPFSISETDKIALLTDWSNRVLNAPGVSHVDAELLAVLENKFYADLTGTSTTQQRVRIQPNLNATAIDPEGGRFETMDTLAPPAGRGWEYTQGKGWDWNAELAELPGLLAEKLAAPSVEPGSYDLLIDPTNLWLTIHESIGHATELDRALGYEAAYAGTSFATPDKLNKLKYGSSIMNVTGDRTTAHGLATTGWDDEGVATQSWDIVKNGTLVGYQLDRRIAAVTGASRSNGCAFADSPGHTPIQRMANVSLHAAPDGPSTAELIAGIENGIYIVGDKSWSIDMQRYNFQFTGQRFFAVRNGKITGQLRDVAYQATTTDFWGSMAAVGGPQTYLLGGAFNCGKGQPGQVAAVSHGCPVAMFRGVRVLNTLAEAGR
ncbi:TldD/PmbA family protein [Sporichthya sp.]|uniref:TldD/PmbA family protein n=1 Tax=Sporichthya sp. TaxID=65475 RepID=UPI0018308FAD|nr:TldD/PmbA family protein [Sporichthya sp.]MBA3741570.1 TldD/PmbA family protein [Sporichthya sp.]